MGDGSVHPVRRSKAHPFRPCRICSALSAPAREGDYERRNEELDRVERQIRAVIDAIKDGLRTPGMKEKLYALEARKRGLAAEVKQAPAPRPRLHPKLADLYRQRVDRLHEELNRTELRPTPPKLLGDLAGILALSVESKKPVTDDRDGLQVTLVAGTRNCLDLLLSTTLNASEEL